MLEAKNEELERFIYTVSHDLKSPLVTIRGFVGLLEKDIAAGDAERVARDLERIQGATERMDRLLNDLVRLSRVGRQLDLSGAVALGELAREAVVRVARPIRERGVDVRIAEALPGVVGDRQQLLEVLHNLLGNAVKFMGEQGEPRVEIGHRPDGDRVVCTVRDNGIGIDARHHDRIFGLFERLDGQREGTGIGLALVKRIVELHGGEVWVESEGVGSGSTFCFSLLRGDGA